MAIMMRKCIVVLGMHRSGTSALTGVLSMCGAYSGSTLLPPVEGVNPKGFWEHSEIVSIHDELLVALGASWDDERNLPSDWQSLAIVVPFRQRLLEVIERDFASSDLWMVKDPRICRLLPLWLDILEHLRVSSSFLICLRHPEEVAVSLNRRDAMPEDRASLLWLEYVLECERMTRDQIRVFVTYNQLLTDWKAVIKHVASVLSLPISVGECDAEKIDRFLEPSLRHNVVGRDLTMQSRVGDIASTVYKYLIAGRLDRIAAAYEETQNIVHSVTPWADQIYDMKRYIEKRNAEYRALEMEIGRVKNTLSWKITRPLRAMARVLDMLSGRASKR